MIQTQSNSAEGIHELVLLTKSEAAKILGIGKSQLAELFLSGRLGFILIGKRIYIPFNEVKKFVKENTARIKPDSPEESAQTQTSIQFLETIIN